MRVVWCEMGSALEIQFVDLPRVKQEVSGEKRSAENGKAGQSAGAATKKAKVVRGLAGNMKVVAEIVLVLAAMEKMRGGRSPTSAEEDMMSKAREKLVKVCEGFTPGDVFPGDAFGAVIEDLGLSKIREQRLGFRPRTVPIAEKLLLTKRQMENSEEFSIHLAAPSQRSENNSSAAMQSRRVPSSAARIFPSGKSIPAPISSGGSQPGFASNSPSLPDQLTTSEVRLAVYGGLPNHLSRDSSLLTTSEIERSHFNSDGRSNGFLYTSQVQANSFGDHLKERTQTWSLKPQALSSATLQLQTGSSAWSSQVGVNNKVPAHSSVKCDGAADGHTPRVAPQVETAKIFISPATSGNLPSLPHHAQGSSTVQAPFMSDTHYEIIKIVQNLLQPMLEDLTWTPPSRDYMNKALGCQMCKLTIDEVDSVLVCDACERGSHLKCLQSDNRKVIPKGEWHCHTCLALTNGKPLPPKYGLVRRNISAPKVSSNSTAAQLPLNKKVGTLNDKINQQKVTANGNSSLVRPPSGVIVSSPTGFTGNNSSHLASALTTKNTSEILGNDSLSTMRKIDEKPRIVDCPNDLMRTSGLPGISHSTSSTVESSSAQKLVSEAFPLSPTKYKAVNGSLTNSKDSGNPQDIENTKLHDAEVLAEQCHDNMLLSKDTNNASTAENLDFNLKDRKKRDDQGIAQANPVEDCGAKMGSVGQVCSLSGGLHDVDWIGEVLLVVDEKIYYQSCHINGIVYRVKDHALFHYNDKTVPFKLKAMWEDSRSGSKLVSASRCYFPYDFLNGVGRPCCPESNEVYVSNHDNTLMAGMIQGPCEVLSPNKFIEESERRKHAVPKTNNHLLPIFLCKWFYDEIKGLFRDVTS